MGGANTFTKNTAEKASGKPWGQLTAEERGHWQECLVILMAGTIVAIHLQSEKRFPDLPDGDSTLKSCGPAR